MFELLLSTLGKKIIQYGLIFFFIGACIFYVKMLKTELARYRKEIEFEKQEIRILRQNISEAQKRIANLQHTIVNLQSYMEKIKSTSKHYQEQERKITKIIPKNKARLSYEEQKKVLQTLNTAIDNF